MCRLDLLNINPLLQNIESNTHYIYLLTLIKLNVSSNIIIYRNDSINVNEFRR